MRNKVDLVVSKKDNGFLYTAKYNGIKTGTFLNLQSDAETYSIERFMLLLYNFNEILEELENFHGEELKYPNVSIPVSIGNQYIDSFTKLIKRHTNED